MRCLRLFIRPNPHPINGHVQQTRTRRRLISYVQGQTRDERTREYFYYVDHHGQLFMDDTKVKNFVTCFKEPSFLSFFFKKLKLNNTDRYKEDFPFISPCGRELNYIRCEDVPLVFTHILDASTKEVVSVDEQEDPTGSSCDSSNSTHQVASFPEDLKSQKEQFLLSYGGTTTALEDLHVVFEPWAVVMDESNGRIYHPAAEKAGGVGLVKSALALQIASRFVYPRSESGAERTPISKPTHFIWNGTQYELDYKLITNRLLSHVKVH